METNKRVREAIIKYFRQRECFTFVRPADEEEQLQNLNSIPFTKLRPEFQEQFKLFKEKIIKECPPKMMSGKHIDGRIFGALLSQYVDSINKNSVNIMNAWDAVIERQVSEGLNDAETILRKKINTLRKMLPLEVRDLMVQMRVFIYADCEGGVRKRASKINAVC